MNFRAKQKKGNRKIAFRICDPGGIQTHDFQIRNLTFYSAELRGRIGCKDNNFRVKFQTP
jgi:hypothetical protein